MGSLKRTKKKKVKKKAKPFDTTLYCRVENANALFAKVAGRMKFGSHSAFVNYLIARYRKVPSAKGKWNPHKK